MSIYWAALMHACMLSCFSNVWFFATLWTVACQAPLAMAFSRQEYWNELLCPPPGYLPDPRIKPASLSFLHWQAGSLPIMPPGKPEQLSHAQEKVNLSCCPGIYYWIQMSDFPKNSSHTPVYLGSYRVLRSSL